MGEILPDGTFQRGYTSICDKCGKVITTNMQGGEISEHECKPVAGASIAKTTGLTILEAFEQLFANRKLHAKRKGWKDESVRILEKGWASQYMRGARESKSKRPTDFYLHHIEKNILRDIFSPTLGDILAADWEVFETKKP